MRSLQPPDILWIHWRLYNLIINTSNRVLFLPPSDAYVRSFLYLLYTLVKLYYTQKKKKFEHKLKQTIHLKILHVIIYQLYLYHYNLYYGNIN